MHVLCFKKLPEQREHGSLITKRSESMAIIEMIDASCELAAKKGAHPFQNDCYCIVCVNRRKRLLEKPKNWKFRM